MRDYLDQIEQVALNGQLYFVALGAALAVPDMCAGLNAKDGRTSGQRYAAWFDARLGPLYHGDDRRFTGQQCYWFRCGFLHQGQMLHPPKSSYDRILFLEPSNIHIHRSISEIGGERVYIIDAQQFCFEMVAAARTWIGEVEGAEPYETNLESFVQRHPNGYGRHIVGHAVIA